MWNCRYVCVYFIFLQTHAEELIQRKSYIIIGIWKLCNSFAHFSILKTLGWIHLLKKWTKNDVEDECQLISYCRKIKGRFVYFNVSPLHQIINILNIFSHFFFLLLFLLLHEPYIWWLNLLLVWFRYHIEHRNVCGIAYVTFYICG